MAVKKMYIGTWIYNKMFEISSPSIIIFHYPHTVIVVIFIFYLKFQGEPGLFLAHQLIKRALSIPGASVHWYNKPG